MWFWVQWVERAVGEDRNEVPGIRPCPKGTTDNEQLWWNGSWILLLKDLVVKKPPAHPGAWIKRTCAYMYKYTYTQMNTHMRTKSLNAYCLHSHIVPFRALLCILCWMWPLCVFVIVKAAASSGSHCDRKQPVMSSESRVADCSIRERQTVCVQPTNSSANSKFTAPGLKFNKTPQRPGPANSTGQHILRWPLTRAIITLYTAISNLGLCERGRAHACVHFQ